VQHAKSYLSSWPLFARVWNKSVICGVPANFLNSTVESTGSENGYSYRAHTLTQIPGNDRRSLAFRTSLPVEKFFSKAKLHSKKEPALCPM